MSRHTRRPSPAMVVACLALFVALAGTSFATVVNVPRASVGTPQLKNNAVTSPKVRNGSLTVPDLAPAARRALAGQQGPAGPAGPTGDKGDKGDTGALGVSEFQRVNAQSAFDSGATKSTVAGCPAGKRVVGGGAGIVGGGVDVTLRTSGPDINGVEWAAVAVEVNPTAAQWYVTSVALCARVP